MSAFPCLFRVFFYLASLFPLSPQKKKALTLRQTRNKQTHFAKKKRQRENATFKKKIRAKRNDFSSKTFKTRANTLRETEREGAREILKQLCIKNVRHHISF